MSKNKLFIGGQKYDIDNSKEKEKLFIRLKELLNVKNVSFLFGNGSSIFLGAPKIGSMRNLLQQIEEEKTHSNGLELLKELLEMYPLKNGEKNTDFESLLATLNHFISLLVLGDEKKITFENIEISIEKVTDLIKLLKIFLYKQCKDLPTKKPSNIDYPLEVHHNFFRKLLLRPPTLPRIKIFTLNYDLIIEKALDSLGVFYIDGFAGTVERRIHTESYNYDFYFPGETTEGKIERVEKVLHLYKLHGSINWLKVKRTGSNICGIKQGFVKENEEEYNNLMIYPSPLKEGEILGYPYSEMFRHFSFSINRPQSVLFTIGYSFGDNHINTLIYQAISIPSFTLVIITPSIPEDKNNEIARLVKKVKNDRILIITGAEKKDGEYIGGAGTFQGFTADWMPDMQELNIEKRIKSEMEKLFEDDQVEERREENSILRNANKTEIDENKHS